MPAFLAPPTRTIYLTRSKYNGVQPGFRGDYKCCGSIVGVCNKMETKCFHSDDGVISSTAWPVSYVSLSPERRPMLTCVIAHISSPDSRLTSWVLVQFCI